MKLYVDIFQTQKAGNEHSEYEDAHWPSIENTILDTNKARLAVADGATDSVYSGLWAQLLVRAYGRQQLTVDNTSSALTKAARIWQRIVGSRPLPWYAEEKARLGSFAALVGLELLEAEPGVSGRWSVLACGDSCFFQVRSDRLVTAFPVPRSEEFSNAPVLLGTKQQTNGSEGLLTATGDWEEGDCFYLMTDALAFWFLSRSEAGILPVGELSDVTLARTPSFEEWIGCLRNRGEIKNDDCTLVSVTFEHAAEHAT